MLSIGIIDMNKNLSSEENDDAVLSCSDSFEEEFSKYCQSGLDNYTLNAKARRRIEDLLEDKKLNEDFDDFDDFMTLTVK